MKYTILAITHNDRLSVISYVYSEGEAEGRIQSSLMHKEYKRMFYIPEGKNICEVTYIPQTPEKLEKFWSPFIGGN